MGNHAPSSTSSPKVRRKRKAPPPQQAPPACRFCSNKPHVVVRCVVDRQDPEERYFPTMDKVMRRSRPIDAPAPVARARDAIYDAVVCGTCGSGDHDDELLICDRCDSGHHTFFLRPIVAKVPIGPWFCPDCTPPVKPLKRFPMKQTKIMQFFDQDSE